MCNYPLAFVIVNPVVNIYLMYIMQQLNKLTKRCCNVLTTLDITHFQYLKKKHLNWIFHIFLYNFPYIEWLLSIANSCHLHCHTKYICSNVAVPNEHTATYQKSTRALTKRCCNVVTTFDITHFQYLKTHLNWIFYIFLYDLPFIQWLPSIENSCHLHCHT